MEKGFSVSTTIVRKIHILGETIEIPSNYGMVDQEIVQFKNYYSKSFIADHLSQNPHIISIFLENLNNFITHAQIALNHNASIIASRDGHGISHYIAEYLSRSYAQISHYIQNLFAPDGSVVEFYQTITGGGSFPPSQFHEFVKHVPPFARTVVEKAMSAATGILATNAYSIANYKIKYQSKIEDDIANKLNFVAKVGEHTSAMYSSWKKYDRYLKTNEAPLAQKYIDLFASAYASHLREFNEFFSKAVDFSLSTSFASASGKTAEHIIYSELRNIYEELNKTITEIQNNTNLMLEFSRQTSALLNNSAHLSEPNKELLYTLIRSNLTSNVIAPALKLSVETSKMFRQIDFQHRSRKIRLRMTLLMLGLLLAAGATYVISQLFK